LIRYTQFEILEIYDEEGWEEVNGIYTASANPVTGWYPMASVLGAHL
jgi:hypothetical protein